MQRKALGRGLSELLGTPDPESRQYREIDLDRIIPGASQPRKSFDSNSLDELAASIRQYGVVQAVVVRAIDGGLFELIAGERRWRASRKAGLTRIPALVRDAESHQSLELALVENVQRENLNPIDEAGAYQRLLSEFNLTQDEIARRVGKNRASVANMLRLLKLPGEVQQWLLEGRLTTGHAKALLALGDGDGIISAAREMMRGQLSVRQAEDLVRRRAEPRARSAESARPPSDDPNVRAALMELERVLGARVTIREKSGKGRLEIHFHSQAELERLYEGLVATKFQSQA